MTDRPLTAGEGNTALWDERPDAPITPEQAHEVAANWKDTTQLSNALDAMANECGRLRAREEQLSGWYNRAEQLKAERDALREQLNTRQWWLDMQYLLADRNRLREQLTRAREIGVDAETEKIERGTEIIRLREQLDAARQALEALWDAAEPYATYRDGDLNAALHATRAALGVEINDGKEEDDEQG